MAFSVNPQIQCPSSSKYSSSHSLHFLLLQRKTHFSFAPKPLSKSPITCCQRLAEPDSDEQQRPRRTQVAFDRKTKRKPRPSFLEQIEDKWSAQVGSRRQKFPWQEQLEVEQKPETESVSESETESESRVESKLSESVSFGLRAGVVSAPWVHGGRTTKPFKPRVDIKRDFKDNGGDSYVPFVNDVSEPSSDFDREFDPQSNGVQTEDYKDEKGQLSIGSRGFENVHENKKNGELSSSGYGSYEDVSGLESREGEKWKWKRSNEIRGENREIETTKKDGDLESSGYGSFDDVTELEPEEGEKWKWKRSNGIRVRSDKDERTTMVSMGTKGFSSGETVYEKKKAGELASSGYDLIDYVAESESKPGEGKKLKWKRSNEIPEENSKYEKRTAMVSIGMTSVNENDGELDYDSSDEVAELESGDIEKWKWKRSNTHAAEMTLPEHELKRLRNVSLRMVGRIKVGARGITQALVETVHQKWELDEVVKLKFEEPLSLNMRRTHGVLENKTGGLVIWRSGSSVVLYRGMTYNLPCVQSYTKQNPTDTEDVATEEAMHANGSVKPLEYSTPTRIQHLKGISDSEIAHLNDLDKFLDDLGPRYVDWLGRRPAPVDADLLPAVVPGYRPPFRLIPYGVKQCVGNKQMTMLRRMARIIPPHFALGRNRDLQGLAKAMVNLWGKNEIAKIAIKRGVENTRNERMAEELKMLTGGTLLSRNKEYIVFYRGNDFLPTAVMVALTERRRLRDLEQDEEEKVRETAPDFIESKTKASIEQLVAGTLAETKAAAARWGKQPSSVEFEKMTNDTSLARRAAIVRHLERKLALAKGNLTIADKELAKVQKDLNLSGPPDDLEILTDEERVLFRKMGLTMKPFLLLGRRGFYAGTIENIHLHWKHRELVKVIMKAKYLEHVKHVANCLEAESGGILVSVDKVLKGFAIVIYRGKNYQSPGRIRPQNLLTKRQALARSTEVQRREALRRHVSDLKERIGLLKSELEEPKNGKMIKNGESSQSTVEDSFLSDGELSEDDEEDVLLDMYSSDDGASLHSTEEDLFLCDDEVSEDDDDEGTQQRR